MSNVTSKKIGALTTEKLKNAIEINGIKLLSKNSEGFEIIDCRPLKQRLESPLRGKNNVIRCFGITHFVVSEKYYSKLTNSKARSIDKRQSDVTI